MNKIKTPKGETNKKCSESKKSLNSTKEKKEDSKSDKQSDNNSLKTSSEWLHDEEFKGTLIEEPTGWDSDNWEEDFYKKKITRGEFVTRLIKSKFKTPQ